MIGAFYWEIMLISISCILIRLSSFIQVPHSKKETSQWVLETSSFWVSSAEIDLGCRFGFLYSPESSFQYFLLGRWYFWSGYLYVLLWFSLQCGWACVLSFAWLWLPIFFLPRNCCSSLIGEGCRFTGAIQADCYWRLGWRLVRSFSSESRDICDSSLPRNTPLPDYKTLMSSLRYL